MGTHFTHTVLQIWTRELPTFLGGRMMRGWRKQRQRQKAVVGGALPPGWEEETGPPVQCIHLLYAPLLNELASYTCVLKAGSPVYFQPPCPHGVPQASHALGAFARHSVLSAPHCDWSQLRGSQHTITLEFNPVITNVEITCSIVHSGLIVFYTHSIKWVNGVVFYATVYEISVLSWY